MAPEYSSIPALYSMGSHTMDFEQYNRPSTLHIRYIIELTYQTTYLFNFQRAFDIRALAYFAASLDHSTNHSIRIRLSPLGAKSGQMSFLCCSLSVQRSRLDQDQG